MRYASLHPHIIAGKERVKKIHTARGVIESSAQIDERVTAMHFMRKLHVIAILATILMAQGVDGVETEKMDVILGKNGTAVKGKIIERIEGKRITVVMSNGQRIDIPFSKISEITTSDTDYEKRHLEILDSLNASRRPELSIVDKFVHLQFNFRYGEKSTAIGLFGMVGMLTNKDFSIGLGVGWDKHSDGTLLPILNEVDYFIPIGEWMPYLHLHAGYSIGWLKGVRGADHGGFRWGTGIGFQRAVAKQLSLTAQIGYEHQSVGGYTEQLGLYPDWMSAWVGLKF